MSDGLSTFIKFSHLIGKRADFVQGAGGNISLKDDKGLMLIKASGSELNQISKTTGIAYLAYKNYTDKLLECNTEAEYNRLTESQTKKNYSQEKASMEVGFHAVLDKAVIHTHNVYANIFLCSKKGTTLIKESFPEASLIEYVTPGLDLSQDVFLESKKSKDETKLFFLKNHGLIISTTSLEKAYKMHQKITVFLQKELNSKEFPSIKVVEDGTEFVGKTVFLTELIQEYGLDKISTQFLFPDQAIYFLHHNIIFSRNERRYKTKKQALASENLLLAYYYILNWIDKKNWEPCFLNSKQVATIMNLTNEKFRQEKMR